MKISLSTSEQREKLTENAVLRYVNDKMVGIYRRKQGRSFVYYDGKGNKISEKDILDRIKTLAIPPAYKNVWICSHANGHIQATGMDDKNRKQYIYHPLWSKMRQEQKFDSLIEFGRCLPKIRKHIAQQLKKPLYLTKEQVLCAIIYLLYTTSVRIGTSKYAKENHSYGLTTLRKKHLSITNKQAILDFPGKNSQPWHVILKDKRLIKLLKKCEEIPGYELFKFYNESGELNVISSQDVNEYLQLFTNHPFTAKNFRTWIACRETFCRIIKKNYSENELKNTMKEVAILLGHTPTICRKSYIDPEILNSWREGHLSQWMKQYKGSCINKDKFFLFWLENRIIY